MSPLDVATQTLDVATQTLNVRSSHHVATQTLDVATQTIGVATQTDVLRGEDAPNEQDTEDGHSVRRLGRKLEEYFDIYVQERLLRGRVGEQRHVQERLIGGRVGEQFSDAELLQYCAPRGWIDLIVLHMCVVECQYGEGQYTVSPQQAIKVLQQRQTEIRQGFGLHEDVNEELKAISDDIDKYAHVVRTNKQEQSGSKQRRVTRRKR